MKSIQTVLKIKMLILLTLVSSIVLAAGKGSDGGGKGIICRDKKGAISSVELLDLWEARTIYKRQIKISKENEQTQLSGALDRMRFAMNVWMTSETWVSRSQDFLNTNLGNINRLRGVSLSLTDDSFEDMAPDESSGCKVEQIVRYKQFAGDHMSFNALVNQDIVDKMDATNKAALALHEGLYAFLKSYHNESNSIRVRRAVGFIFSGGSFESFASVITAQPRITCKSFLGPAKTYTAIHFTYPDPEKHPNMKGTIISVPEYIAGSPMMGFSTNYTGYGGMTMLEFFQKLQTHQITFSEVSMQKSPTDYDARAELVVNEQNEVFLNVKNWMQRSDLPENLKLTCEYLQ